LQLAGSKGIRDSEGIHGGGKFETANHRVHGRNVQNADKGVGLSLQSRWPREKSCDELESKEERNHLGGRVFTGSLQNFEGRNRGKYTYSR